MRKNHFSLCCVLLCLLLSSCRNSDNSTISIDNLADNTFFNYEVSTEEFTDHTEQKTVEINHPVFRRNQHRCAEIDQLLQEVWDDHISDYGDSVSQLTLSADYEITYASDAFVSIVFRGTSNVKSAAHPITFAFSVNILMKTPRIADTEDLVEINDIFAQKVINQLNTQPNAAVAEYFQQFTLDDIVSMLQQEDVYFYFTSDGIGVLIAVPHAIGDYVDLQIPYRAEYGTKGTSRDKEDGSLVSSQENEINPN